MKVFPLIAILVASANVGNAQEWVFGLGYADFSDPRSSDQAVVAIEYHAAPFLSRGRFDLGVGVAVTSHANGDLFAGLGLAATYGLNRRWFFEASVLPGYYSAADPQNDLGSNFQFRSLLGIGYRLDSGDAISVALTHKSNAGITRFNPGVNAVMVRLRHKF